MLQQMMDAMSDALKTQRADYQLTLNDAIIKLTGLNTDLPVIFDFDNNYGPSSPDSYRGYYSDLAFEPVSQTVPVSQFMAMCQEALGKTFTGYKGGDFLMDKNTPLWCASYGNTGPAIIDLSISAENVILITKHI